MDPHLIISLRGLLATLKQQATASGVKGPAESRRMELSQTPGHVLDSMIILDSWLLQYQAEQMKALQPATEPKANTGGTEG